MLNSPVDIALLFGIALLVFGPKKLPELGKSLGQGIGNFKRHLLDAQEEVKTAIKVEPAKVEDAGAALPKSESCCAHDTETAKSADKTPSSG
jgi:sec-independent protein translocase protein TatA